MLVSCYNNYSGGGVEQSGEKEQSGAEQLLFFVMKIFMLVSCYNNYSGG